jgi:hypothetical protein
VVVGYNSAARLNVRHQVAYQFDCLLLYFEETHLLVELKLFSFGFSIRIDLSRQLCECENSINGVCFELNGVQIRNLYHY